MMKCVELFYNLLMMFLLYLKAEAILIWFWQFTFIPIAAKKRYSRKYMVRMLPQKYVLYQQHL